MQIHFLKPFLVLSLIICFTTSPYSQYKMNDSTKHPYKVNYWVSGGIAVVGGLTNYLGIPAIINKQEISAAELSALNKDAVGGFDRWVLNQDLTKEKADGYDKDALIVLSASVTLPAILAFDKYIGKDWSKMLVMYLETISIVSNVYTYSPLGPKFNNR
ncbi:MAG: phosphatase family protein, partial [Sediminibacterium sp.]|nr:phosphatase family protein [Sediminibacterium sp.]